MKRFSVASFSSVVVAIMAVVGCGGASENSQNVSTLSQLSTTVVTSADGGIESDGSKPDNDDPQPVETTTSANDTISTTLPEDESLSGEATSQETRFDGVIVFAGHSFFEPATHRLSEFAENLGVSDLETVFVFAGGDAGAPEALWSDSMKHAELKSAIDTHNVSVLGLTYHPMFPATDGYVNWINYALSQNSATKVVIGWPWSVEPENVSPAEYRSNWESRYNTLAKQLLDDLHAEFPDTTIILAPFGAASVELYDLYSSGDLPSIDVLVREDGSGIYSDAYGHPGNILMDLANLILLDSIIESELTDHSFNWLYDAEYDIDLREVAERVTEDLLYTTGE